MKRRILIVGTLFLCTWAALHYVRAVDEDDASWEMTLAEAAISDAEGAYWSCTDYESEVADLRQLATDEIENDPNPPAAISDAFADGQAEYANGVSEMLLADFEHYHEAQNELNLAQDAYDAEQWQLAVNRSLVAQGEADTARAKYNQLRHTTDQNDPGGIFASEDGRFALAKDSYQIVLDHYGAGN